MISEFFSGLTKRNAFYVSLIVIFVITVNGANICSASLSRINIEHAEKFEAEYRNSSVLITLKAPYPGAESPAEYLLVPVGSGDKSRKKSDVTVIEVPVKRCVSTTTVNIAFLRELGVTHTLVGQGGKKYVYSPDRYELNLPEVGEGMNLDLEKVLALKPDVVFAYAFSPSEVDNLKRLEKLGVKVVFMSEYLEDTPLGRAEWIKYISMFFSKEEKAELLFRRVRNNYISLREKALSAPERPKVLVNEPLGGTWYVPAGNNWVARILSDAGANYPWSETPGTGSLSLDLEAVLSRASDADYWINTEGWKDLDQGIKKDERYSLFRPFRKRRVYSNTARMGNSGGNDYHQYGVMRPDLLLADLVSIFHPGLIEDHSLVFYKKLD